MQKFFEIIGRADRLNFYRHDSAVSGGTFPIRENLANAKLRLNAHPLSALFHFDRDFTHFCSDFSNDAHVIFFRY